VQPSLVDLGTVKATLDIIRMAGNPRTVALLTRVKAAGVSHEARDTWLTQHQLEVATVTLGERSSTKMLRPRAWRDGGRAER